ncbi:MAG: hypothetical protein MUF75_09130 [Bacteroidia bacterium]|jgi:hypothetical protein|nr:hypothetical protein [Bacteroidia bacterium]
MKKLLCLFALIFLFSCSRNELEVDVSGVEVTLPDYKRLDEDVFTLNENNFDSLSGVLVQTYGPVYQKYLMNPLRIAGSNDSNYRSGVLAFIKDKDIRSAQNAIQGIYTETKINALKTELNTAIKYFKYHFPERTTPEKVVFCQTGWNYAFAYVDKSFLIGLDMYLGEKAEFYKMLAYPLYQTRKMSADYLLADVARGWLLTEFDNSTPENKLLNHCVFYGKLFYAVNALLPEAEDSIIIGYTGAQLRYCKTYEKKLWAYFAEKNRLYDNNLELIRELTGEGPFTGSISKDCPPRIAMWVGWQIVRSYMKNNKAESLEDMMMEKDAAKILNKSKYRP